MAFDRTVKEVKYMFDFIMALVHSMREREEGQALVEYALILALVSVVAIGSLTLLGGNIDTILNGIATTVGGA
jgi:pilus assembly protein Flp/PilA